MEELIKLLKIEAEAKALADSAQVEARKDGCS